MNRALLISGFLLLFTASASAANSVNGTTGLISNPSADVLREGQISLSYYNLQNGGVGIVNVNAAENVEIGLAGFRYDDRSLNKNIINIKYNPLPEGVLTPGLALGVEDAGAQRQRTAYLVASKALPFGFRIHAGVGNGRYGGFFGAVEKTLNPVSVLSGNNVFPATTLIAEYDGHRMNFGARMSVVPGLKIDAGWRDHNFYCGLNFTVR